MFKHAQGRGPIGISKTSSEEHSVHAVAFVSIDRPEAKRERERERESVPRPIQADICKLGTQISIRATAGVSPKPNIMSAWVLAHGPKKAVGTAGTIIGRFGSDRIALIQAARLSRIWIASGRSHRRLEPSNGWLRAASHEAFSR
jgi:hypothetical protein